MNKEVRKLCKIKNKILCRSQILNVVCTSESSDRTAVSGVEGRRDSSYQQWHVREKVPCIIIYGSMASATK